MDEPGLSTAIPRPEHRRLLSSDRVVVLAGIALLVALAWTYLALASAQMQSRGSMGAGSPMQMDAPVMTAARTQTAPMQTAASMHAAAPLTDAWSAGDFTMLFAMWAIMMVAMMLPSATPMIALFAGVSRGRREHAQPWVPTAVFVAGYIVLWTSFAAVAALAQWGLHRAALISPMMMAVSAPLGGTLLIAAGAYQFAPLKRACLSHCRSPLAFLSSHWHEGSTGALRLGIVHGAYCIGCCAVLMSILFVAGVMNLLWIATISVFVLLEKVVPHGDAFGRATGIALVGWGLWLVIGGPTP